MLNEVDRHTQSVFSSRQSGYNESVEEYNKLSSDRTTKLIRRGRDITAANETGSLIGLRTHACDVCIRDHSYRRNSNIETLSIIPTNRRACRPKRRNRRETRKLALQPI